MAKILHGQDKARGKVNRQESSRNHPRQRNDKLHPPDKCKQRTHHGAAARTLPLQERRLGENHRRGFHRNHRKGRKSCRSATGGSWNRRTMQHSHSIYPEWLYAKVAPGRIRIWQTLIITVCGTEESRRNVCRYSRRQCACSNNNSIFVKRLLSKINLR